MMSEVKVYLVGAKQHALYANFAFALEQLDAEEAAVASPSAPAAETAAPATKPAPQKDPQQMDLVEEIRRTTKPSDQIQKEQQPVADEKVTPITAAPSHPDHKPVENKPADMDAAIAAARAYITKKGVAEARKLLDQFKVNRVSDLQPAQIADFVRAATV